MPSEIKAIETVYQGYRFRSRLEARWAVFFNALDIKWEYEPEGFELSNGSRYLPDFWLPTFNGGIWAEVKPDRGDFQKMAQLCKDTGGAALLCHGMPDFRCYTYLTINEKGEASTYWGIPNADQAWGEDRLFMCPGYETFEGFIEPEWHDCLGQPYIKAVHAARSARFEHR